jgi:kumamolisin
MPERHTILPGTRRPLAAGARRVRDIDPNARIEVTINLKAPDLPPTDKMPASSMSVEDFVHKYGVSQENIAKVEEMLRSYGLRVEGVGPTNRSLRVSGSAAAMQSAFQSNMAIYHSAAQGEFRAREGENSVPAELADLVDSVVGLDQRRVAERSAAAHALAPAPLAPAELEKHYNFPVGDCADQKVAIAEFGSPLQSGTFLPPAYFPDDITSFCQSLGRPVPNVATIPVNLAPLTPAQYASAPPQLANDLFEETAEVMMDIEIVASLCSAASISVYYATWDQKGWLDLIERVTGDRPVCLSISYGLAEDSPEWEPAVLQAINRALQAAAMVGITVCVSSGDDGTNCDMPDSRAHVEFPGCSPFVLSVGGTMLSDAGDTQKEVVWWESPGRRIGNGHSGATGGGVSGIFARPAWQTVNIASINNPALQGRIVPDVAALAGPPLYQLIFNGQPLPDGGTSASAPLWASLLARLNAALPVNKRQRFLAPLLYQNSAGGGTIGATGCTDIVSGNNTSNPNPGKGYQAQKGYDAVTGWGVPNGEALLTALQ